MKIILVSLFVAVALVVGAVLFSGGPLGTEPVQNVVMVDGVQIITVVARGGYSPVISTAQANVPTILRMKTTGTFDCSSAFTIPELNFRTNLPPSGITEIEIPPQKEGSTIRGVCAMGMYSFTLAFQGTPLQN